jgi:hypothetical protein
MLEFLRRNDDIAIIRDPLRVWITTDMHVVDD